MKSVESVGDWLSSRMQQMIVRVFSSPVVAAEAVEGVELLPWPASVGDAHPDPVLRRSRSFGRPRQACSSLKPCAEQFAGARDAPTHRLQWCTSSNLYIQREVIQAQGLQRT